MDLQQLDARLQNIESLLLAQKTVLTFEEVSAYTGLSKSYLYKLTSAAGIPHFKPQGKHIYFSKAELDQWLQRNLSGPLDASSIEEQAETYITLKKMGGVR
ncbi:helix-turn-helix domain-containing protein [Rufibacter roseolus]|uniref:helix-turn-helix domain-containing protein n=1 Tax=Rufibacter roseolus TaxID=2817375 RepID=UPI001B3129A3|nr:helix-turn-helix domain-containing protein [Rufibacter roseolus]